MKMSLLVTLFLSSIAASAAVMTGDPNTDFREYESRTVESIRVVNGSGRISVTVAERPRIYIVARKIKFPEGCTYETRNLEYREVEIISREPNGNGCQVDLELRIPKEMNLRISSGSGRVDIAGIEGALNFEVGSGEVVANGRFTKLEGRTASGRVDVSGLVGEGRLDVGSGPVKLKFNERPTGSFEVKSGSGLTEIALPRDSKIRSDISTGAGTVTNEISDRTDAEFNLSVRAGSGDVNVKVY